MTTHGSPATRPRYQTIADELISDILAGHYAVGSMMPTEHELCGRFDVSRYTVREALRQLREMGLVSMRRGSGTMVLSSSTGDAYVQSIASLSELVQYPGDTRLESVRSGEISTDKRLSSLLGCQRGTKWFVLGGLRRRGASDPPICWQDFYVTPGFADVVDDVIAMQEPFHKIIEEKHGEIVVRANLEMFASRIDDDLSGPLMVEPGSPAMTIVRRYMGRDDKNFLNTVSVHPEGRFIYSMELQRDWRTRE